MRRRANRIVFGLGCLVSFLGPAGITAQTRTPALGTPHFAFYNDFDTNLNDALIASGAARTAGQPELFRSDPEAACFDSLPHSTRAAWNEAVTYYADVISPKAWSDREQFLIRVQLAGFDEEVTDSASRQFVDIARSFRAAAAPAYDACRWPAQREKNRRWIAALQARLSTHEETIARRLETVYGKAWTGLPIRVDVVERVDWSGANSIFRDAGGGHLLISNAFEGDAALEIVFHEASHLLMKRGDPVRQALAGAARTAHVDLPADLWHVVLFYTTGEVVREALEDSGERAYTPIVDQIFERSAWVRYRTALAEQWAPFVRGERPLSVSAAALLAAIDRPQA